MKNIVLLLFLTIGINSYSQKVKLGPYIGISHSNYGISNQDSVPLTNGRLGYSGGIFAHLYISSLYFSSNLGIMNYRTGTTLKNSVSQVEEFGISNSSLYFSLMGGFKIGTIRIGVGPYYISQLSQVIEGSDNKSINLKELTNNLLGFEGSLGLNIAKRLTLDFKVQKELESSQSSISINNIEDYLFKGNKTSLVINIGYSFIKF